MAFSFKDIFSFRKSPATSVSAPRGFFNFSAGKHVSEDSSMKVAAYYRGVIYISTQIAKLPWYVKSSKYEILEQDPIHYLLNIAPNSEMNALRFRLTMIQNAIHHGNAYAEIERDMLGRVKAIWPLPSKSIEPIRDKDTGELFYRGINLSNQRTDVFYSTKEMFHLPNFHTKDGLVGEGLVSYARDTLGISIAADGMAGAIFENGGFPNGVLTHPGRLSDEAYTRLKDSWKDQYGGRKSGSAAILEEGVVYAPIEVDPSVLQFLESRKFGVLEIARFLGLPPTKLFDTTATTFSNMENANLEVATDTLDSWACNLEAEANVKLLSGSYAGKFTELDLYSVFRGDMKTRADYFSKMMQVGAITPNQIREREGMAPYTDGDRYYIAVNNYTPADRLDEVLDANMKKGEPAPAKDVTPTKEDKELKIAALEYLSR